MKVKKEEKKSSSSEKFDQTLSSIRKERKTLPVENSQKKKVQTIPSRRTHKEFSFH
jgi:hypothetical protein